MPGILCNLFSFKFTYSYPSFINFLYSFVYQLILMPVCNDKEGPRVGRQPACFNTVASRLCMAVCSPPFSVEVCFNSKQCLFIL